MSEKKTYVFHVSRGADKHERFELTEDELEPKHRKLLLGSLRKQWENTPKKEQEEFIRNLAEKAMENVASRFKSEMDKRLELDDRIDQIIKAWKVNKNVPPWSLIEQVEKDYDYVSITCYPNSKLVVKIHDGVQEFN